MAIASRSWVATVNHHANPHSFSSPKKPVFFLSQKPHISHVCSSRCSLVLEEDEKKSPSSKQDKWPFFEPVPDGLNLVLSRLLRDPETQKLSSEFYEKAKENSELRTTKHLINYLVNAKNWDLLVSLCEDLREYNALPDAHTCSQLIRSCIRERKFRVAHCLLSVFRSDKTLAVFATDSAMKGFNKLQMYSSTIQVFDRMKQYVGVEPSPGCYCRIMEAHERIGDNQKVVELFQEFKSKRLSFLAKESGSIYTILCTSLAKSGRAFEALEFLEEMKDKGIQETSALYSTLIRALAGAREVTTVEKLFKEAGEKKLLKDPEMCLKVVLMYVREGKMERTLEVVAAMRKNDLRVSDCILCAIVNGFSKQRGFAEAVRAYEWLKKQECEAGQVTYAITINAYCRLEEYEKAEMLFDEMVNKGFDKCVVAYSNIIDMYGKTRRLSDAVKLMAKMKQRGCKPNIWIYNSLIDMHGRAMDLRRVEKIWKEMKRMKVLPDKVSYTSMIGACNRAKELERCVELYNEFRMNRGKIDRAMAGIMVGVFSKTSRIDELMRLLQDMKVERTKLDARLYSSALNALRDAGLNSQIRWLQESFDTAQTGASRYSNTKSKTTLQGS
ncbi:hypothetical protein EUTSA_v10016019mg [Eutrema salsugineum]|uniref:Pentacotripeptide-repeat region of PRORP domain-containing protein n=1 Tax=Eutrema salsugineum TaxID=72664 RepID=V4LC91_EUTSA|nr:pentatricopeptide repeat-containing protein At5g13770, chloroplastic [Eutrema salsugineum]ESQ41329.1 hypothetical protein EUTSA_v10016019mg [Eutrema salsugineum]